MDPFDEFDDHRLPGLVFRVWSLAKRNSSTFRQSGAESCRTSLVGISHIDNLSELNASLFWPKALAEAKIGPRISQHVTSRCKSSFIN